MPLPSAPTARVVSDDQGPRHYEPYLRWLGVALGVVALISLVRGFLVARLISRLQSASEAEYDPDVIDIEATIASLRRVGELASPLMIVATIAVTLLLFLVWSHVRRGRLKTIALVALISNTIVLLLDFALYASRLANSQVIPKFVYGSNMAGILMMVVFLLPIGAILWFLAARNQRRASWAWAGLGVLALGAIMRAGMLLTSEGPGQNVWLEFATRELTFVVGVGIAAALAWLASGSAVGGRLGAVGVTRGAVWAPASNGLQLYGTALLWRLILTIGGYLLLIMALKGRSYSFVKTLGWALPLMGIITGGIMTIGVFGYANQPEGSRGRPPALFAAIMMAIALLIDLLMFVAIIRFVGLDANDGYKAISDAQKSVESAQSMAVWGMALSLAAFVALLSSFHMVARDLDDNSLANRAFGVGACVVVASLVAVGVRMWLGGQKRIDEGTILIAGLSILAAVLVAVIAYLSFVGRLQHRLADEVLQLRADDESPPGPRSF